MGIVHHHEEDELRKGGEEELGVLPSPGGSRPIVCRRLALVAVAVLAAPLVFAVVLGAQEARPAPDDHDHERKAPAFDSRGYTPEELARIDRLFGMIVCKCPDEGWTRSLSGCPNSCADEQKSQVRAAVKAGWSDERILDDQRDRYGPKAIGRTSAGGLSGMLLYLGPFLAFLAFLVVVVMVVRRLSRPLTASGGDLEAALSPQSPPSGAPGARPSETPEHPELSEEDRRLGEEIERELEEMD